MRITDEKWPPLEQDWPEESAVKRVAPEPFITARDYELGPDPVATKADALERAAMLADSAYKTLQQAVQWFDVVEPGAAEYRQYGRLVAQVADLADLIDVKRGKGIGRGK